MLLLGVECRGTSRTCTPWWLWEEVIQLMRTGPEPAAKKKKTSLAGSLRELSSRDTHTVSHSECRAEELSYRSVPDARTLVL